MGNVSNLPEQVPTDQPTELDYSLHKHKDLAPLATTPHLHKDPVTTTYRDWHHKLYKAQDGARSPDGNNVL